MSARKQITKDVSDNEQRQAGILIPLHSLSWFEMLLIQYTTV